MTMSLWAQQIGGTLAGVVVGGLLAWLISHVYAHRATRNMARQRDELARYNRVLTALFHTWEEQGLVELSRDSAGEITGGRIRPSAASASSRP